MRFLHWPLLLGMIVGLPALVVAVMPGSALSADVVRCMNIDLAFDDGSAMEDFGSAPRAFLSGGRADLFGPDAPS